jgi:uncharacterized OsmC-like protein
MRNGLNISGVSEFVHEIKSRPEEATVIFNLSGIQSGICNEVRVNALELGTIRSARGFIVGANTDIVPNAMPSCWEYLLLGLGSCVLVTYVQGNSAKGITIDSLKITVGADVVRNGSEMHLDNFQYVVRLECDGSKEDMAFIASQVTCFSPNHRSIIEDNYVGLEKEIAYTEISSGGNSDSVDTNSFPNRKQIGDKIEVELQWEYGSQARAIFTKNPFLKDKVFYVDQPKQVVGIDLAPNPQEYLFAALINEVTCNLEYLLKKNNIAFESIHSYFKGGLDFRGLMNIDSSIPVKIHNLLLKVIVNVNKSSGGDSTKRNIEEMIQLAFQSSIIKKCIEVPQEIRVKCYHQSSLIADFVSNMDYVIDFLNKMKQGVTKPAEIREEVSEI